MKIITSSLFLMILTLISFSQISGKINPSEKLSDIDGNSYVIIRIGLQTWMSENLKVTRFNNGDAIPLISDSQSWFDSKSPGYCWYNNDGARYKASSGALYNWYAVGTGRLCPAGWHLPDDTDWNILSEYISSKIINADEKEKSIQMNTPDAERIYGNMFDIIAGGVRIGNGSFSLAGFNYWWSASESDTRGTIRYMYSDKISIAADRYGKNYGFSVRCLKD